MTAAAASGPELVRHAVPAALDGLVAGVVGFRERSDHPVVRRQPAGSLIPLVLSFGPTLDVIDLSDGMGTGRRSSFIAGFMPGYATTSFEVEQHCVQIYLTPPGACRLLGLPGRDLARRLTDVVDVLPAFDDRFLDELWSAGTWPRRFAIIDRVLLALADHGDERAPRLEPFVEWMWGQIQRTGGRARIGDLAERTGWSRRHVISRFTEQIGLAPKAASSVVRFEHASAALLSRPAAEVAAEFGYSDQSHLVREVRRFTGWTPTALIRAEPPTAHTAIGSGPLAPR